MMGSIILFHPSLCYDWLTQQRCYMSCTITNTSDNHRDYELGYSDNLDSYTTGSNLPNVQYGEPNTHYEDEFQQYKNYEELKTGIIIYCYPFLLFFSTVGNGFTILILYKFCRLVWSTCVYLAIAAILDQMVMYVWCGHHWLYAVSYNDLTNNFLISSSSVCKMYTFFFNCVFHMQKWLLVCVSVECFIAAKYPHKVLDMCTLSKAKSIILLLTVIIVCLNIHFFWTYELHDTMADMYPQDPMSLECDEKFRCMFVNQGVPFSETFEQKVWPVMDSLIAQIIPLVTIMTFASMALYYMQSECKLKDILPRQRSKYILYPNALNQCKLSFIFVCFTYVLTLPRLGFTTFIKLNEKYMYADDDKTNLASTVCFTMEYIFLSLKFYLLILTCKQFREEFFKICNALCHCCAKNVTSLPQSDGLRKSRTSPQCNAKLNCSTTDNNMIIPNSRKVHQTLEVEYTTV